jgi:predicted ester cyclase
MSDGTLIEDNKALVRRVVEEIGNGGKMELLGELVLPGFIRHHERNRDADLHGADAFRDWILAVRGALPDLRLSIEQMLGEDDRVMVHLRGTGTHRGGTLKGVAATGTPLAFTATAILRVAGGRLAEAWVIADTLGILQQLGAVRRLG